MGNLYHVNNHLKKRLETISCTLHTAKQFLQESPCGDKREVATLNSDRSPGKSGKSCGQSTCPCMWSVPSHMTKQVWGVINDMHPDSITAITLNDYVIIKEAQHLLNKGIMSAKNQQSAPEKMQEIRRVTDSTGRVTTVKTMEDFTNPKELLGYWQSSQDDLWL